MQQTTARFLEGSPALLTEHVTRPRPFRPRDQATGPNARGPPLRLRATLTCKIRTCNDGALAFPQWDGTDLGEDPKVINGLYGVSTGQCGVTQHLISVYIIILNISIYSQINNITIIIFTSSFVLRKFLLSVAVLRSLSQLPTPNWNRLISWKICSKFYKNLRTSYFLNRSS